MSEASGYMPWPAVGQFWARSKPKFAALIEVTEVKIPDREVVGRLWAPNRIHEVEYQAEEMHKFEFLWFESAISRPAGHIYREGEIRVNLDGKLFFIGPRTNLISVQILATWRVQNDHLYESLLFQAGPPPPSPPTPQPQNAFKQILANADAKDE